MDKDCPDMQSEQEEEQGSQSSVSEGEDLKAAPTLAANTIHMADTRIQEPFSGKASETWESYLQRFGFALAAQNITDEGREKTKAVPALTGDA